MQLNELPTDRRLVLDDSGKFFEIPADLLSQFRISEERLHRIVAGLPRDAAGRLQVPDWLKAVLEDLDPDVEAQGRILDLAAVAVLAAAGCVAPVGSQSAAETEPLPIAMGIDVEPGAPSTGADSATILFWDRTPNDMRPAEMDCVAFENGAYAPARGVIAQQKHVVWEGVCGVPVTLGPGVYDVAVTLDGTLDRATIRRSVIVAEDQDITVEARFDTSILEVRIQHDRERVAGIVRVLRDGQEVGTLGSYIPARLSSGTYELLVSYRTEERVIGPFDLAPTQRRAFTVSF